MEITNEIYLRLPEVSALTGIAKSTVWKWIGTKGFPKQYKLASRVSVWKKSEVDQWMIEQLRLAA